MKVNTEVVSVQRYGLFIDFLGEKGVRISGPVVLSFLSSFPESGQGVVGGGVSVNDP